MSCGFSLYIANESAAVAINLHFYACFNIMDSQCYGQVSDRMEAVDLKLMVSHNL